MTPVLKDSCKAERLCPQGTRTCVFLSKCYKFDSISHFIGHHFDISMTQCDTEGHDIDLHSSLGIFKSLFISASHLYFAL